MTTHAETISAAIAKLERLKNAAAPGPWEIRDEYPDLSWDDVQILTAKNTPDDDGDSSWERFLHRPGSYAESDGGFGRADAELILTLHRTIDAQLAILRHTLSHYRGDLGIGTNRLVVDLAADILAAPENEGATP